MKTFPSFNLLGIRIHVVFRQDLLAAIKTAITENTQQIINNVNVHAMNIAWQDQEFSHILNHSDMVFIDGAGVSMGAKLYGYEIGDRLTYMDWMDDLFDLCEQHQWPVFLLGDNTDIGQQFQNILKEKHPGCPFVGHHHGFFDQNGPENDAVIKQINDSGAKILLAGMSMPIQEKWVWKNKNRLEPNIFLAAGAFHRWYIGDFKRGPKWMTQNGLEWLHRLITQPKSTWKRYIIGNTLYLWHLIIYRWQRGDSPNRT